MVDHSPITIAHFWTKVRAPSDFQCWEWQGRSNRAGYGRFVGKMAHRFAYTFFNGPIPEGLIVRHRCDNPKCCNPAHLEVGTHQDNSDDKVKRGRASVGAKHGRTRLTLDQAIYIRTNPDKKTLAVLAKEFGIAESTASYVRSGRSWKYAT